MEYCCHTWAGALGCYLELLDRTIGPSLAVSLELLDHHQDVVSLGIS